MATEKDYAALSAYVYNNERGVRSETNTLALSVGWQELRNTPNGFAAQPRFNNGTLGFTGGAYISTSGEIVIAFKGTDFLVDEGRKSELVADMVTNVGLAIGKPAIAAQLVQAAEYYAEVKKWALANGYNPASISFTGHSLGGGIASVMTAWTGLSSTVFAQAPFQIAGLTPSIYNRAKSSVDRILGATDAGFNAFVTNPLTALGEREPRVLNYYVQGEFLELLRLNGTTINGRNEPIDAGTRPFTVAQGLALHSMNLHAAFLYDDNLRILAKTMPELIPALLDTKLYASDPNSSRKDLITTLVNDQLRQGFSADSALKRFAGELMKLQATDGMAAQGAVRTALIAVGMDYFYNTEASAANKTIFTVGNNGINFKLSDLGIDPAKLKSPDLLANATRLYLDSVEQEVLPIAILKGQDAWHIQSGTSGMIWTGGSDTTRDIAVGGAQTDILDGGGGADILIGGAGADFLTGGAGKDMLLGGAENDVLNGGTGSDTLIGGQGTDIYQFISGDGGDTIQDSDGLGSIVLNGNTLSAAKAAGERDTWKDSNGVRYKFIRQASETVGTLIISTDNASDAVNIKDFNLTKGLSTEGYLGIKLDPSKQLAIKEGGGSNVFAASNFDPASLAGLAANIKEGAGKTFTIFLNAAAKAGETLTLAMAGLGDKFKAILGDSVVDADGAIITLAEGQTQVSFALVQEGEVTADASTALSVSYQGTDSTADSNSYAINLKDAGPIARTYLGDQKAPEITDSQGNQRFNWGATSWANDGTLIGGIQEDNFADVIYGSSGNDKINGLGGNDALSGGAGNDEIDGGDGDDLIAGGAGSDNINGGAGNDYISSSAPLLARQRSKPTESWSPPGGEEVKASSATWGVFIGKEPDGSPVTVWDGISNTSTATAEGDVIDGGAGNDNIIASWGDDRIMGGEGKDQIDGLAGNDIIEGGDGDDYIRADGIPNVGNLNSTDTANHGADFLDGGAGNDYLEGAGKADQLFGGAGNDQLWGDVTATAMSDASIDAFLWGADYLDGEDGDDQLVGGGMNDTLYGGAGNDVLFGDQATIKLTAELQGEDYLDGEDGNDYLEGGAKADTLYGGAGDDVLWGDARQADLAGADHGDDYLDGEAGRSSHYEFRSCLRPYLLAKTSIRYPKTAQKVSPEPCVSRRRVRSSIRITPDSIAACARKQGVAATFDRVKHIETVATLRLNSYSDDLNRPKAQVLQMRHVLAATRSSFTAAALSMPHLTGVCV